MTFTYHTATARRSFHLPVGQGHQLHIEEYGDETGIPVMIFHGGPGSGLCAQDTRYFNPGRYRIILFSQRGCGESTPECLEHNTTPNLLHDVKVILDYLDISACIFAGGSWGATLAILSAISYPTRTLGLVVWASFLAERSDLKWLYSSSGAGAQFYPEQYALFSQGHKEADEVLEYYFHQLFQQSEVEQYRAAQQWCGWEHVLSVGERLSRYQLQHHKQFVQQAKIMVHYFYNHCFIEEQFIANHADVLTQFPVWFVHSRHDYLCRFAPIQQLAERTNARLLILDGVGHCSLNQVYFEAIRRAADILLCKFK